MNNTHYYFDFAISYAGEDVIVAEKVNDRLRELGFNVFFAKKDFAALIGNRGDDFFEELFTHSKQVIVFISEAYKRKDWTQFEWDIIRKRENINRFIPVRLDNTPILGLPDTIIYLSYPKNNIDEIENIAVKKLLEYEKSQGIKRETEYERILDAIKNESKGALAQAYQLVIDNRTRDPLEDVSIPELAKQEYQVIEERWLNFSVVKRLTLKITLPKGLSQSEIIHNMKHCSATLFNAYKPDGLSILAYFEGDDIGTAGKLVFAPFGKWEKIQDGVAYNIPVFEFEYEISFVPDPLAKLIMDITKLNGHK